ncbi:hypothetical protein LTR27_000762 [Elasticomyces elasticus]|nr:hypothetical protein LTR27_000762 [Elasticomyces elasticus]
MPPAIPAATTKTGSSTTTENTCSTCGNNTGLERIDGTKLNNLIDTVTNCLISAPLGNLLIKGSKTDAHLGKLVEVTSLNNELREFKAVFEKYIALHASKELDESDKPVAMNKNMRAVVDKLVEEKLDKETSALKNRVRVLEEAETARKKIEDRSKINGKAQKVVEFAPKEKVVKCDDAGLKAELKGVREEIADVLKVQDEMAIKVAVVEGDVSALEPAVRALENTRHQRSTPRVSSNSIAAGLPAPPTPAPFSLLLILGGIRTPYIYYGRESNPDIPVNPESLAALRKAIMHYSNGNINPRTAVSYDRSGYYVNTTQHFLDGVPLQGDWIDSDQRTGAWLTDEETTGLRYDEYDVWRCYDFLGVRLLNADGTSTDKLCPVPELRLS